jgi:glucosylceramidase
MNKNGKFAVVIMNTGGEKLTYKMYVGKKAVELTSLPHSIATLVF